MNTKQLRQKILDLAIRGKLVPQDPADEPASVLLERIHAEHKNKTSVGTDKSPYGKSITNYELKITNAPFEVPGSWVWVTGEECFKPIVSKKPTGETFGYIDIDAIDNKKHIIKGAKYLDTSKAPSRASRGLNYGDTLFSMVRPYLENIAFVDKEFANCIASTGFFVCKPKDIIYPKYLYFLMLSSYVVDGLNAFMKGDNSPSINNDNIMSFLFPIPPLAEQHRIVSVIESAFTLIDEIEENKASLKQIIKQAKAKTLDLAIRGKLVQQDETTAKTTADNLPYTKAITNYELKITDAPFEIPENWMWVTGKDCFNPMESKKPSGKAFGYIDIDAIDNKKHEIKEAKYLEVSKAPSRASRGLDYGDTLFSMVRPYLENIAFVDKQFADCIASTGFFVCKPKDILYPKYLYFLMLSPYVIDGLNAFMKGDNSPSINNDNIMSFYFPLPPLVEQHRIVARIEQIFAQLDEIETALTTK